MIPVNYQRLYRALQVVNKKYKIPHEHRLRARYARSILSRMNCLREEYDIVFHSALVHAAAEERGVGIARAALYRKSIALYAWWTRKAMRAQGVPFSYAHGIKKMGADVALHLNAATGQYEFFS